MKNYITHDATLKITPIRESQWKNSVKGALGSTHSHEAPQIFNSLMTFTVLLVAG